VRDSRDGQGRRTYRQRMAPPIGDGTVLEDARALFAAHEWRRCADVLRAADAAAPLCGEELLLLGQATHLIGDDEGAVAVFARAYRWFLDRDDPRAAVRGAFGAGFVLDNTGESVRSGAWADRARDLVEQHSLDGAEAGLLLANKAHRLLRDHRVAEALDTAREGERVGLALRDADVLVLNRLTIGFALLVRGERAEGIRVLDEILVAVSSDETMPAIVGVSYCSSIAGCLGVRDVGRARAWTAALDRWCAARPDLVPYRGMCLVHRAQMSTLGGSWAKARAEALTAERFLAGPPAGAAAYQLGELCRLAGDVRGAEDHYRRANSLGMQPEPGLSRLRIGEGRAAVAETTLRRLCAEPRSPEDRAELLAALVDAQLALGDVDGACATAEELHDLVDGLAAPLLHGLAEHTRGTVRLADGRPGEALASLDRARAIWQDLDLPHACAQARVLSGRCLSALGDEPSAALEFEAARDCFVRLGALPDVAHVDALTGHREAAAGSPLTERELEVVRLVAAGHTNRGIAGQLVLSEKTVARHLANIYAKLDVPSRAAATAYAYDHGLV
jgi:DNA-binding CsgD family transcriptional regulator